MKDKHSCNSTPPDKSMDKSLLDIANIEAGTDVKTDNGSVKTAVRINSGSESKADAGVTDNAPYTDIAEYKMVAYLDDDENEDKKELFNTHGS